LTQLRTPKEVLELALQKYQRQAGNWLMDEGEWPWRLSLGSPTEAEVQDGMDAVRAWVAAWSEPNKSISYPFQVERVERSWPKMGRQHLPSHVVFSSPLDVALAIGKQSDWNIVVDRAASLAGAFPALARHRVLAKHYETLARYADDDFARLRSLLIWTEQRKPSNLYLRQLPIEGLHTKWIETRRQLVRDLLLALRPISEGVGVPDLESLLGLKRQEPRMRLRVLCSRLRAKMGGLTDVEAPVSDIARLPIEPSRVLIVENQETALALPDMDDVVVIFKLGMAVALLREVPWIRICSKVMYWGDVDTHGFLMLHRARQVIPQLQSVLMDVKTLEDARHLAVQEQTQASVPADSMLVASERQVLDGLLSGRWGERFRLEQERLEWAWALAEVRLCLTG